MTIIAYVTIPKDLTRVKSKVLFGLTRRQLICFGAAVLVGVPLFFLLRNTVDSSTATLCMILVHKIYLSAILDLYDRRIAAYILGERNDNALVFQTFDKAVEANPDAHPLFHSDRGFQYTNRTFHAKLEAAGMTQSMSRVAHCIDNGPMEGFWGILKRERYYGRRFTSKEELMDMIHTYIAYYNNCRVQRNLGILTPMEKHRQFLIAA